MLDRLDLRSDAACGHRFVGIFALSHEGKKFVSALVETELSMRLIEIFKTFWDPVCFKVTKPVHGRSGNEK